MTAGSLWAATAGPTPPRRPPLRGATTADVVVVGGGYSGLWTALSVLSLDPARRVVVLEAESVGFGASGRNGGWASALFAGSRQASESLGGPGAAERMRAALVEAVDDIGRTAEVERIDCHFARGGTLALATSPAHVERLRGSVGADETWLTADEARDRIGASTVHGGVFDPDCAAIHPLRLARGLADAIERRGGVVHEGTRAVAVEPRRVVTDGGEVIAEVVIRATEAYTSRLPGLHRRLLPVYSLMIATEPLPGSFWDEVGWRDRETVTDGRHALIYAQRTADDRIAFGGRGAPYHFGSRVRPAFDLEPRVFRDLERTLHALFPAARRVRVTHRWGGALAIPRDWYPSVGFDASTGMAWGGGYVGDGVAASCLAGRTLGDLVTGHATARTALPWVDHRSRDWEPEPLRWLGVNAALLLAKAADCREARTGHRAVRLERALATIAGH